MMWSKRKCKGGNSKYKSKHKEKKGKLEQKLESE